MHVTHLAGITNRRIAGYEMVMESSVFVASSPECRERKCRRRFSPPCPDLSLFPGSQVGKSWKLSPSCRQARWGRRPPDSTASWWMASAAKTERVICTYFSPTKWFTRGGGRKTHKIQLSSLTPSALLVVGIHVVSDPLWLPQSLLLLLLPPLPVC